MSSLEKPSPPPKISIVIPCYNQGAFLDEAVESVLAQSFTDFEIIVVDDGSTEEKTKNILSVYQKPKTRLIRTTNQGLSAARNNGIAEAKGEYILPLDADDKIGREYLEKAVKILDTKPNVGIVYCLAETFGYKKEQWSLPQFSPRRMLLRNLIFAAALYRKTDWATVQGYKSNMREGWEDWDFWLSLLGLGRDVEQIPQILFYYRRTHGSMVNSMDRTKKIEMHMQLMRNHQSLFIEGAKPLVEIYYKVTTNPAFQLLRPISRFRFRRKTP